MEESGLSQEYNIQVWFPTVISISAICCELPVPAVTFPSVPSTHLHPQALLPEPLSPALIVTEELGSSCCELEPDSNTLETRGLLTDLPLNFCGSGGKSLISPGFPHKFDRVP